MPMPRMWFVASAAAVLTVFAGCANVEYGRVPYCPVPLDDNAKASEAKAANVKADTAANGIRYYETAPYLLVFSDGKGGIKWKIYYLPDQSRKRTIEASAFLATINTTHGFTNGTLTNAKAVPDSTALPKAIISTIQGVLSSAAGAALLDQPPAPGAVPPPQLYKIVIKDGQIELRGGAGNAPALITRK